MTPRSILAALLFGAIVAWAFDLRAQTPGQLDARPASTAGTHATWSRVAENRDVSDDDATVLILAQAMVADGGWDARHEYWDHEMIAHALLSQSERRGVTLRDQALAYVAAFDPRRRVPRAAWIRCLNLEARKPCEWPISLSWAKHVDLWLGIIDKARAFLADPSATPNPCPDGYHFGTRDGADGARAKRAGWARAACWATTRNGVWAVPFRVRRR